MTAINAAAIKFRDWSINFLNSSSKTHNMVLLGVAWTFYKVATTSTDPLVIAAVGSVLGGLYGANAWAGTHANRTSNPAPAVPVTVIPASPNEAA